MNELEERISKIEEHFDKFKIVGGQNVNVSGGIKFGGYTVEVLRRVVSEATAEADVPGCTDPTACNFDESATVDDSSCTYGGACCVDTDCTFTCEADCEGVYQGDDTFCNGDTCLPTGACCVETDCNIRTEAECADFDGTYQGDDTVCDPNPCLPPCPEITLLCDSISADNSKCGYSAFDGSGAVYRRHDFCSIGACDSGYTPEMCAALTTDQQFVQETTSWWNQCYYEEYDSECVPNRVDGAEWNLSHTTFCDGHTATGPGTFTPACFLAFVSATVESCTYDLGTGCTGLTGSNTLSEEYTTDELKTNTEAELPAYFDHYGCQENEEIGFRSAGQGCNCFASRELSEDEADYAITRFKYIFSFDPSFTDMTISWNEHTEPDAGGAFDTPMSELILAGNNESSIYEVLEPADNGLVSITDITCTPA